MKVWKEWSLPLRLFAGLIAFSIFGTILSRLTRLDPGPIPQIASIATIGVGVWVIVHHLEKKWIAFPVLLIGATSEIIGLKTDFPFGDYIYSEKWWPTVQLPLRVDYSRYYVFESVYFPLQLPFAWLLIVGGAFLLVGKLKPIGPVMVALVAASIDFWMEAVMVEKLKYWSWGTNILEKPSTLPGGAPLQNTIGWFAVSLLAAIVLSRSPVSSKGAKEGQWLLGLYCLLMLAIWVFRA